VPNDLRLALRSLVARPGFTLLAAATLALGIGANAGVFSLLDALYFRPLPLREPRRLVRVTRPSSRTVHGLLSHAEFLELAGGMPALESVAAVGSRGITLHHEGEARLLIVKYVSSNVFEALGVPVLRGRGFRADDARSDAPLVIVNQQLWRRLGARADLVGGQLRLNDSQFTVLGVVPAEVGFERGVLTDAVWILAEHARFAVPGLADELVDRSSRWFEVYGRLRPGADLAQARAQAAVVSERWGREDARAYGGAPVRIGGWLEQEREQAKQGAVFLGLAGLVLLIACANTANLMLARSEGRRRELAVRVALGATPGRLLRQLSLESLLLSLVGAAVGLVLAYGQVRAFPALAPPATVSYALDTRFDARLLAFTALLLGLTTSLVAAVPAWRQRRPDVASELKQAGRSERPERRFGARDLIVVSQMALSVVGLVAAGLLVRSLQYGSRLAPGYDPQKRVATFYLVPGLRGYDAAASHRFFEESRRRALSIPGVERASYAIRLPAQGNEAGWAVDVFVPGQQPAPGEDAFRIRYGIVGPDYFEVLGARLLRGRGVRASDNPGSAPVAVINRTMAERLWPGADPIGKRIVIGRQARVEREIVGVAENGKIADLYEAPEMYLFVPFAQQPQGFALLLLETAGAPASYPDAVRKMLDGIDPGLPILASSSLERHRALGLFEERRDAAVAGAVAAVGLGLSAVGLYGVMSLVTARRTREIGIRLALGARRGHVLGLVLGRGAGLALAGAALGAGLGAAASRLLGSRLHGVDSIDPLSFGLGTACLLAAALAACALPALRATRVDPIAGIREE
jgi:predicted permease